MTFREIVDKIDGKVVVETNNGSIGYNSAFASDLMSDVLTLKADNLVLITGLATLQTIRTAEMADINCIILARNKKASPEIKKLALDSGIDLIECTYSMYRTSGLLFQAGLKPVF